MSRTEVGQVLDEMEGRLLQPIEILQFGEDLALVVGVVMHRRTRRNQHVEVGRPVRVKGQRPVAAGLVQQEHPLTDHVATICFVIKFAYIFVSLFENLFFIVDFLVFLLAILIIFY
jgi:hypothetical protein